MVGEVPENPINSQKIPEKIMNFHGEIPPHPSRFGSSHVSWPSGSGQARHLFAQLAGPALGDLSWLDDLTLSAV